MSADELPRVLCVDDEPNLLAGLQRTLFGEFDVTTATSGEAGLAALKARPGFAVVVSDMRMPGMDGASFLAHARQQAPDTVRILLTGQADTESAIAAINQGAIFRFLCKPCPGEALIQTLGQAVTQYRLVQVERDLLETTLTGAVKTLTEVLSMVAPWASQRAATAQTCVRHALATLAWPEAWAVQMAAALSHIGYVSVPTDIVQRELAGQDLSEQERRLLDGHVDVAYRLLASIPRLEDVARMVRFQATQPPPETPLQVFRGAQLLRASLYLAQLASQQSLGGRVPEALSALVPPVASEIVKALSDFRPGDNEIRRTCRIRDLMPGWVVLEDILTTRGMMVLKRGSELSATAVLALRNLQAAGAIGDSLLVSCPAVGASGR